MFYLRHRGPAYGLTQSINNNNKYTRDGVNEISMKRPLTRASRGALKQVLTKQSRKIWTFFKTEDRGNEPIFHIISGTSIGAINATLLVSYVKENKTWEGSGERLVEFWEYLSTQPSIENIPYFTSYWDSWRRLDRRIASGESARRYYSTKEFILKGVPNVFVPRTPSLDTRFFDPSNTWYIYDNRPLKESLEKFAKFPISTSFEKGEPRLLLVAVDVQESLLWFLIVQKGGWNEEVRIREIRKSEI